MLAEFLVTLRPVFEAIGQVITVVGSLLGWLMNLNGTMGGVIKTVLAMAAGAMAGYLAYMTLSTGVAAVRIAINLLTVSTVSLKAALVSTGIGASWSPSAAWRRRLCRRKTPRPRRPRKSGA